MSSTVAKALALLDFFTETEPELGLSELARRAGVDKATVHRMLGVMSDAGLVEQSGETRLYRLGAGVLRLARVREVAFPITAVTQSALEDLAAFTGETAHASLVSGRALATVGICESNRGSRVSLVAGEILPFHTTASGLATLAYSSREILEKALGGILLAKTPRTVTDAAGIMRILDQVRTRGYAEGDQTNEDDVYGIAVPLFDRHGTACGAIAVATPAHRMTPELRARIIARLVPAGIRVTEAAGGQVPAGYRAVVAPLSAAPPPLP